MRGGTWAISAPRQASSSQQKQSQSAAVERPSDSLQLLTAVITSAASSQVSWGSSVGAGLECKGAATFAAGSVQHGGGGGGVAVSVLGTAMSSMKPSAM